MGPILNKYNLNKCLTKIIDFTRDLSDVILEKKTYNLYVS